MADILIRMEMPESCERCPIYDSDYGICNFLSVYYQEGNEGRINGCPLHKMPEHGDLIDRDAFRAENEYYLNREFINPKYEDTLDDLLKDAPVVIPSNKENAK